MTVIFRAESKTATATKHKLNIFVSRNVFAHLSCFGFGYFCSLDALSKLTRWRVLEHMKPGALKKARDQKKELQLLPGTKRKQPEKMTDMHLKESSVRNVVNGLKNIKKKQKKTIK